MKKVICLALTVMLVMTMMAAPASAFSLYRTIDSDNVSQVMVNLTITDSGMATVNVTCVGYSNVTSISVKYYIEQKINGTWTMVIFDPDSPYFRNSTKTNLLSGKRNVVLTEPGEYRAVATFTVVADTTETITATSYASF